MKNKLKNFWRKIKKLSFYKKKPFYIVLVVLLSLMLVADIAIAIFVPEQNNTFGNMQNMGRGGMSEFNSDTDEGEESSDANTDSDSDDTTFDADTDSDDSSSDADGGDMPSGDFDKSDFDRSDMPSRDFNGGDMPDMSGDASTDGSDTDTDDTDSDDSSSNESFDFSEIQPSDFVSTDESFLQKVKAHWLVIFIILLVLDGASIFMLAWISHKEKKIEEAMEEEIKRQQADGEVHLVRPEKKKKHSYLFWIIPVLIIIIVIVVIKILTGRSDTEASETEATVYSETAELSDISTVLPGAGTLTEEDAETFEVASEVEISSWYVSNGDIVEEGDKIAEVDKVSVMTAIVSVQEMITELDEDLAEHEDEEISDEITAGADGRVMAIYAEEDASIVDVMYENAALMLISLDGNMAVDIETEADISVGDSVDVTLSDDTVLTGKVYSITNGTAVITVSDEDTTLDDEVSVATEDGDVLGSGTLYIHSELKVTGFAGTVDDIEVSVGDEVDAGDTLITLDDTEYEGEYDTLVAKRNELEEEMQELFQLYQDGCIYASCSGVISGISSSDTSSDDETTNSEETEDTETTDSEASSNDDASISQMSTKNTGTSTGGVVATIMTTSSSKNSNATSSSESSASTGVTEMSTANLTSTATLADSSSDYVNYIGMVTAVGDSTIEMKLLPNTYTVADYSDLSGISFDEASMTETGTFDISTFKVVFTSTNGTLSIGSSSDIAVGDTLILAYDANDTSSLTFVVKVVETTEVTVPTETTEATETTETTEQAAADDSSSLPDGTEDGSTEMPDSTDTETGDTTEDGTTVEIPDTVDTSDDLTSQTDFSDTVTTTESTDTSSVDISSDSTTDVETAATEETEVSYSIEKTTLFSVTPQDTMTITITVDELDILSLEEGQEALVTLDAFPGQSFDASVTSIDTSGTNSGGSTKFTAEVTIDREEDMLAGMNASVVITLETKESVLSIPEAALVEDGNSVYVYTSYDEESDTFGDLVEVTTGVSDGENVEILSGLDEGSEFYYSYLDVVNYTSSSSSTAVSGFSFESMFGGGGGGGNVGR